MTETKANTVEFLLGACRDVVTSKLPARRLAAAALAAATLLATGPASATLMDSIDALSSGDMYRVMFMTSTTPKGDTTDIGGYNQVVIDAANAGSVTNPLGLSWSALASTAADNAQTNTGVLNTDNADVSFFNTNGDLIATSGADLWSGSLLAPIMYDEDGAGTGNDLGNFVVWTGTDATGATSNPLGADPANDGRADFSDARWTSLGTTQFDFQRSLYGVSAKVTVPTPEPTTLALLGLAMLATVFSRRRISFAAA